MNYSWLFSVAVLLTSTPAISQEPATAGTNSEFHIPRLDVDSESISIDGIIDEDVWFTLPFLDQLLVTNPDSLAEPAYRTEIRVFYNDDGIYISAMNYQPSETLVARLSARDARVRRDAFGVSIDPSGNGLYGYSLRVNLGGSLSDSTILPERQMSRDWDGPWQSATQELDDGWSTEMFLPWSMMSMPSTNGNSRQIGLYFDRTVAHLNQTWSWPPLPNTSPEYLSAFESFQIMDVSPRSQITLYPYISSSYDNITGQIDKRIGTDVYWRPNSSTQLSVTINPDFGAVESDDIVVNLGAFETFFTEKRSFFLEGNEVFNAHPRSTGDGAPVTILNTRRIGASADYDIPQGVLTSATERNQPVDLLGAAKSTGQIGSLRYGLMAAVEDNSALRGVSDTGESIRIYADGRDFLVGRVLYESTTGGGRRSIGWMGSHMSHPDIDATVNGIDLHYFSQNGRWVIDGQFLRSSVSGTAGHGILADLSYRPSRGIEHSFTGTYLDDTINLNNAGFLRRNDRVSLDYEFSLTRSGFERYRTRETTLGIRNGWNTSGRPLALGLRGEQEYTLYNNSTFSIDLEYDAPRVDDRSSRGDGSFRLPSRIGGELQWSSDRSRPISYLIGISNSQEDLKRSNIRTSAGVTWQPTDRFYFDNEVNYRDRNSWLIRSGPGVMTAFTAHELSNKISANYFFSPAHQLRMSMQWTGVKAPESKHYRVEQEQISSLTRIDKPTAESEDFTVSTMSFQVRYQWEIAPLSDLFVIYTRGSNVDSDYGADFSDLFQTAWSDTLSDTLVAKLRYRF
jgi:hypothetical protein